MATRAELQDQIIALTKQPEYIRLQLAPKTGYDRQQWEKYNIRLVQLRAKLAELPQVAPEVLAGQPRPEDIAPLLRFMPGPAADGTPAPEMPAPVNPYKAESLKQLKKTPERKNKNIIVDARK